MYKKKCLELKKLYVIKENPDRFQLEKLKCPARLDSAWKLFSSARLSSGNFSLNSSLFFSYCRSSRNWDWAKLVPKRWWRRGSRAHLRGSCQTRRRGNYNSKISLIKSSIHWKIWLKQYVFKVEQGIERGPFESALLEENREIRIIRSSLHWFSKIKKIDKCTTKNSQRIPQRVSKELHVEFPKEFLKNSQKIPKKFPKMYGGLIRSYLCLPV